MLIQLLKKSFFKRDIYNTSLKAALWHPHSKQQNTTNDLYDRSVTLGGHVTPNVHT